MEQSDKVVDIMGGKKLRATPLFDRIFVKADEKEEKMKGKIIVSVEGKKRSLKGTIVAVGGGRVLDDPARTVIRLRLKKGDRVMFGEYTGMECEVDGEDLLMMKEEDVIALIW